MSAIIPNPNTTDTTIGIVPDVTLPPSETSQSSLPVSVTSPVINSGTIQNWADLNSSIISNSRNGRIENNTKLSLNSRQVSTNDGTFINRGLMEIDNGNSFTNHGYFEFQMGEVFVSRTTTPNNNEFLPLWSVPYANGLYPQFGLPGTKDKRIYHPHIDLTSSEFVNSAGATLFIDGTSGTFNPMGISLFGSGATLQNSGTVTNNGIIDLNYGNATIRNQSGGIFNNNGRVFIRDENTSLVNNFGGNFTNSNLVSIENGFIDNYGEFTNSDDLAFGFANSTIFTNYQSAVLINNGTIDNSFNPLGAEGFINNGSYSGSGIIKGSWTDRGVVKAGNSSGGLLIDGDYRKEAGTKEIELGGTDHFDFHRTDTEHDFVEITGDLIINGGTLDVSLIDDFKLDLNQEFDIVKVDGELTGTYEGLEEGAIVGSFDSVYGQIPMNLFITYEGGDGNDIALYTADKIFGLSNI